MLIVRVCLFIHACSLSRLNHVFVLLYIYVVLVAFMPTHTMCYFIQGSLLFNVMFVVFLVVSLLLVCLCVFACTSLSVCFLLSKMRL